MRGKHYRPNLVLLVFGTLVCAHISYATHDSADSIPMYQEAAQAAAAASAAVPMQAATVSQQEDPALVQAVEDLGARIGDLFVCVPGKADTLYSTQSWYMMNTFLSFNNNLARSTLAKDAAFSDALKKRIEAKALAQIKARNPELDNDEAIKKYVEGIASTAEYVFKTALSTRETYSKSTKISPLIAKSHADNDTNVFDKLKSAHSAHVDFLKRKDCVGLKKNFWETPHFSFTTTDDSAKAATPAQASKTTTQGSSSTSSGSTTGSTPHKVSEKPEIPANAAEFDKRYPRSKRISEKLPYGSWDDRKTNGYHTYYGNNGYLWGRPYVIGNILKAASVLKEKGIYMGVGDINREPYVWPASYHRETPGHSSHDEGRAVDLRLIGPDGEARPCTVEQPSCYDRDKTFEMVKALIDADPKELRVIYINDPKLRGMIERYLVNTYGWSKAAADDAVQYWPCHDNHVHFHWRSDYASR